MNFVLCSAAGKPTGSQDSKVCSELYANMIQFRHCMHLAGIISQHGRLILPSRGQVMQPGPGRTAVLLQHSIYYWPQYTQKRALICDQSSCPVHRLYTPPPPPPPRFLSSWVWSSKKWVWPVKNIVCTCSILAPPPLPPKTKKVV